MLVKHDSAGPADQHRVDPPAIAAAGGPQSKDRGVRNDVSSYRRCCCLVGGLLFLAGVHLNDLRLLHNNVAPGTRPIGDSLQLPPAHIAGAAMLSPLLDLVLSTTSLLSGRSTGRDRFRSRLAGIAARN